MAGSSSGGSSFGWAGMLGSVIQAYGAGANDQENAKIERDYAIREATRIRRKGEKQLGDMYIAVAKSGFRPTGSVMDEIYRTAGDIEENAQNALRRGNQSAWAYDERAKNAKSQAKLKVVSSLLSSYGGGS